jgi:hypothetical protein
MTETIVKSILQGIAVCLLASAFNLHIEQWQWWKFVFGLNIAISVLRIK